MSQELVALRPIMTERERDNMLMAFAATIDRALGSSGANFAAFMQCRNRYEPLLRGAWEQRGLRMTRLAWRKFWRLVFPLAPPQDSEPFLATLFALTTPAGDDVRAEIRERAAEGANTFLQMFGRTGTGKSSVLLSLLHEIRPFQPGRLMRHVVFDQGQIGPAMAKIEPEEWVVSDEQKRDGGEGSKARANDLSNNIEMGRASRKSLAVASPAQREYDLEGVELETFAWSLKGRQTAVFCGYGGIRFGYDILPFCEDWMRAEYLPPKTQHVERAVAGDMRDKALLAQMVNEAAEDPIFADYLVGPPGKPKGKPKPKDFELALDFSLPRTPTLRTMEKLAKVAHTVCYNWDIFKPLFQRMGVEPAPGLERVANSCYSER